MVSQGIDQECTRCQGTGRVATKGAHVAVLCSCPAGRHVAAPPRVFFFAKNTVPAFQAVIARG